MSVSHRADSPVEDFPESPPDDDTFSLFEFVSAIVRSWRLILLGMVIGGAVAGVQVIFKQYAYKATASFAPQNADQSKAGISALAGAFGILVPTGNLSQSPQFYAELLTSRAVLAPIVSDTFSVPELKGPPRTVPELFGIQGLGPDRTTELSVGSLASTIRPEVNKTTGTITVSVTTPWRSFSLAVVKELLKQVNLFNLRTRQSQASDEARFIEQRLGVARAALQQSESRLETFLGRNRQTANSPDLVLNRDRLQRDVDLDQQVATSLSQSLEDARIREVRDIPVITVIDPPVAQTSPESRGRVRHALFGMTVGGGIAIALALLVSFLSRRIAAGDPEIKKYVALFGSLGARFTKIVAKSRAGA